jgi:hypothetical protein
LDIHQQQACRLGLSAYQRLSPVLTKACLRLCANESYQNAEVEIAALTGMEVGHSSLHRLVQQQEFTPPEAKQAVHEVSIDGGKVRLRGAPGGGSAWRDYKAARLNGVYYGGTFQDPWSLTNWINVQPLTNPLICLGDGHDGIWNVFDLIATVPQRCEILDWYHLKENLYKVGGSLKRLAQAEHFLWQGDMEAAKALFNDCRRKQAANFCAYLDKHRHRIVNYSYLQVEQIASIGSGAVESAVKQIDRRLQLSGAQWKAGYVNAILSLRCAYLNGMLAI